MNEFSVIGLCFVAGLINVVFATFCALGGRSVPFWNITQRAWGRLIAPIFMGASLLLLKHNWLVALGLISYPLCWRIGHGYNGTSTLTKIGIRAMAGLVKCLASIPVAIATGSYLIFILQCIIGVMTSVLIGTNNPKDAPIEEFLINLMCVLLVPFMVL